ncbi:hypothetical protein GPALN_014143 [Globodera pallida]|nr:hypothetical protein GPALN_014143 [Globodera pallida]
MGARVRCDRLGRTARRRVFIFRRVVNLIYVANGDETVNGSSEVLVFTRGPGGGLVGEEVGADDDRKFDQFGEIGGGDEDDEDDWKQRARKAPNYRRKNTVGELEKGRPINGKKFPTSATLHFGKRHTGTPRSALTPFPSDLPPALASGSELPNATSRKFEQFTAGRELSPERQPASPARPPTASR